MKEAGFTLAHKVSQTELRGSGTVTRATTQAGMARAALMCENTLIWELGKDLALHGFRCVLVRDLSTGCSRHRVRKGL